MKYKWDRMDKLIGLLHAFHDPKNIKRLGELAAWTLWDENRMAAIEGRDVFERDMPPLQYRLGWAQFHGTTSPMPRRPGLPPFRPRFDNLTIAQYQRLRGPRLAPRGEDSRIVRNFHMQLSHYNSSGVTVQGSWQSVRDQRGRPILPTQFRGGRTPIGWNVPSYPMGGIRLQTMREILGDIDDWADNIVKRSGI